MIKLIGAAIVVLSMSAWGYMKCSALKSTVSVTEKIVSMLELMKNEICGRKTPMKNTMKLIKSTNERYITEFADEVLSGMEHLGELSFSEIWGHACEEVLSALPAEALTAVRELGHSLGRYETGLQKSAIERCTEALRKIHAELRTRLSADSRMYMGAYCGIGLIAAIVLI